MEIGEDRIDGLYQVDTLFNITTWNESPIETTDMENIYLVFLDYIYAGETRVEVQRKYYRLICY
ncbi:hypothetical protein ES703_53577 [subsurface metagenome]